MSAKTINANVAGEEKVNFCHLFERRHFSSLSPSIKKKKKAIMLTIGKIHFYYILLSVMNLHIQK